MLRWYSEPYGVYYASTQNYQAIIKRTIEGWTLIPKYRRLYSGGYRWVNGESQPFTTLAVAQAWAEKESREYGN